MDPTYYQGQIHWTPAGAALAGHEDLRDRLVRLTNATADGCKYGRIRSSSAQDAARLVRQHRLDGRPLIVVSS